MALTNRPRSFGMPEDAPASSGVRAVGPATLTVTVDLDQVDLAGFAQRLQDTVRRAFREGALVGLAEAEREMAAEVEAAEGARTDS